MDVGLALPQYDGFSVPGQAHLPWSTTARWAQGADRAGLHSVWLSDHLAFTVERYGGPPGLHSGFDPIVGLAALARQTTRVRLGTLVLSVPLRPPSIAAKALSGIDRASQGRVIVGLGAGNFEPDFEQAGIPFEPPGTRLARLADAIAVMRGTFAGGPFDHHGPFYETANLRNRPPAVQQPSPPIWVGGKGGPKLLQLVAEHADGWNLCWTATPDDYATRLDALAGHRDPATVDLSLGLYTLIGEDAADVRRRFERLKEHAPPGTVPAATVDEYRRGRLVGTVEEVQEQLRQWSGLGIRLVVACLGAVPFSVTHPDDLDALDLLAAAATEGVS